MRLNRKGITPVVAVAILIAITVALVAAIAAVSSTAPTNRPAPIATFSAEASVSEGIYIYHEGGDTLYGGDIRIQTYIPSGTYQGSTYEIPSDKITNLRTGASAYSGNIQPGDTLKVANFYDAFYYNSDWGTYWAPNVGEQFYIEIVHKPTDKLIARVVVTVAP